MVVSVSADASRVGRDVLADGGNAVDAAVATAFALAVTFPEAGNIGGGGFMVIHPGRPSAFANRGLSRPIVIDYRESAPAAATRDMFASLKPPPSHLLVGVPGTVRGLALAHQKYGSLPWRRLVEPAEVLARQGFTVDADLARALNDALARAADHPEFRRVFRPPNGNTWTPGDRLAQPELAATLRLIADQGERAFYSGPVAHKLVQTVREGGGILTESDLANYQAKERQPIHNTFRGHDLYAPPPPSSGGVALVEMLNILEHFDLTENGPNAPQTLHFMIEAMRLAYFDRARHLGDMDFVPLPNHLTSKDYAKKLAAGIDSNRAGSSESLAAAAGLTLSQPPAEGEHTTHFSVIDSSGMAVANTYTLEQSFGGMVVVKGCGFILNNEMGDFNARPGHTDRTGRIGTPPNEVAPGKRMLSSMTPTIIARDGRVVLVTGTPGGRTIINTVLRIVTAVLAHDVPARQAVDLPRLHHQWLPDVVKVEHPLAEHHPETIERLRRMGHQVQVVPRQGDAHTIEVSPDGTITGVADGRRSGAAGRL